MLAWYDRNRRDLPWRKSTDPYRVWLSEMMLQQTQVATVIPYYERFCSNYPTVDRLAAADLRAVLKHWAGLGYYARARNMHRAAKMVVEQFDGRFPKTRDELRQLPGVGPYSAAAIASIAFREKAAVVDGNVNRVLARLFCLRGDTATTGGKQEIALYADALAPDRRCGDYNQAMMELGATICTPGSTAKCDQCPIRRDCRALADDCVTSLPIKKKKIRMSRETHAVAAIRRGRRWLVVQRPESGLWGGLWELPTVVANGQPVKNIVRRLANDWTSTSCNPATKAFCHLDRQLTHKHIRFTGFVCDAETTVAPKPPKKGARWLAFDQLRALPMSTAMLAVVDALEASETNGRSAAATSRRASSGHPARSR